MPFIETLAQQLGTQAATTGLGAIFGIGVGKRNDRRQLEQQRKLQELEMEGQRKMGDYNYAKQMQMWHATSYGAQKAEMNKAGINPALMYGMSGGGGQTTGSQGGNVTGAQAPAGGREQIDMMGIQSQAAQLALLNAQRENIEADTANKKADTENKPKIGKNIEASTASLTQGVENAKAQQELTEVETRIAYVREHIAGMTQNAAVATIHTALREATARMNIIENEKLISDATRQTKIDTIKEQLTEIVVGNELKRAQTEATKAGKQLTDEEINKVKQEIMNLKNYWELDNYIEREKVRLIDKGINVAIIQATLGSIMHFGARR